jgi:hypothetical protein
MEGCNDLRSRHLTDDGVSRVVEARRSPVLSWGQAMEFAGRALGLMTPTRQIGGVIRWTQRRRIPIPFRS